MSVSPRSVHAYREHVRSGNALKQWERVYAYIERHQRRTRKEISRGMGLDINVICGRVRELLDAQLITEVEGPPCSVTRQPAARLVLRYCGGASDGYTPEQIELWREAQERTRVECLAREILTWPRAEQVAFYRRWKERHGAMSAAHIAEAIKAERKRQEAAA